MITSSRYYDFEYERELVRTVQSGRLLQIETSEWRDDNEYNDLIIGEWKREDAFQLTEHFRKQKIRKCRETEERKLQAYYRLLELEMQRVEERRCIERKEEAQLIRDYQDTHPTFTQAEHEAWEERRRQDLKRVGWG